MLLAIKVPGSAALDFLSSSRTEVLGTNLKFLNGLSQLQMERAQIPPELAGLWCSHQNSCDLLRVLLLVQPFAS